MDHCEEVLSLITINSNGNEAPQRKRMMNQDSFPFRTCDVSLPQCNTGFVYMLISIKDLSYTYIGMTDAIRRRVQEHNSGIGSKSTAPAHLRHYALYSFICGFSCNRDLCFYVERQWKDKRDRMISNGVQDTRVWANCGEEVISELDIENYGVNASDLTMVNLFKSL